MISLILALVAGIQPREVLRAIDSPLRRETSFRLADAHRLDPRHKGEVEGWWRGCRMKESWKVDTTRIGHDETEEFPQTRAHRMTGSVECAKPTFILRGMTEPTPRSVTPAPEPGSSRRTSVSRKDSFTQGKRVSSRDGHRVTGCRIGSGMTESWETQQGGGLTDHRHRNEDDRKNGVLQGTTCWMRSWWNTRANMTSLILALVAGIQPREVLHAMDSRLRRETSFRLADAYRLDPRHKGKDEGWLRGCRMKESWAVGTTRRGHDGTKEFPQTRAHRMTGSMEGSKPPSSSVE
jgi:hypothetical protein